MTEIVAAHLERVAREMAEALYVYHYEGDTEAPTWAELCADPDQKRCVAAWIKRAEPLLPIVAAALAACAREEAEPLLKYAIHKNTCKGFPAFSEAQLALDCNCGLQAIKSRLAALERAAGEKAGE